MKWLESWIFWVIFAAGCAVFVLPHVAFYQVWMPYGYDLGGIALVVLYLSIGFGSLGLYCLIDWLTATPTNRVVLKVGTAGLCVFVGLICCYLILMDLTPTV